MVSVNVGGAHWCLCVAHVSEGKVQYYDSMGGEGRDMPLSENGFLGQGYAAFAAPLDAGHFEEGRRVRRRVLVSCVNVAGISVHGCLDGHGLYSFI